MVLVAPCATRPASVHRSSSPASTCQNALLRGSPGLEEMRIDRADQRHVGSIEPDDAMVAFVDVSVPAHRRREDQVAVVHLAAPSIDDGGGAFRPGGKPDGRAGVTMRARAIARLEDREGGEQRAGRSGVVAEGRMRHDQRAPLDVVDRHLADRAVQERLDIAPAPMERLVLGARRDRGDALIAIPQRVQVLRLELGHEWRLLAGGCDLGHGSAPSTDQLFGSLESTFALSIS